MCAGLKFSFKSDATELTKYDIYGPVKLVHYNCIHVGDFSKELWAVQCMQQATGKTDGIRFSQESLTWRALRIIMLRKERVSAYESRVVTVLDVLERFGVTESKSLL